MNATARPRSKDSSSTATCRSRPLSPFDRRECRAPVNRDSAIDVRDWTGPERGASPEESDEARAERVEAEVAALKEKVAELRERNGKLEGENKVLREHSERLFAMLEARPKQ